MNTETILLTSSVLLLLSLAAYKISNKIRIPSLLLFLILGMLAGSEGIGGIYFDDANIAQFVGTIALISILFSGGFDTDWKIVKPIIWYGTILSTFAVFFTAFLVATLAYFILHLHFAECFLLGAIVSSTDAAAVFTILRADHLKIKKNLLTLIEFESASNDAVAVILTIGAIEFITSANTNISHLGFELLLQIFFGIVIGIVLGNIVPWIINKISLDHEGLYPVFTIGIALLSYSLAELIKGNGFIAVYLTGIVMGNQSFFHKKELLQFHNGLTWLMQIAIFLILGLLVFPSKLLDVVGADLIIALFLIFFARPISIYLLLIKSKFSLNEKIFVSWVGLRGAVPIILATFPIVAKVPNAHLIFNMVFFIVLSSILVQGTTIPAVAKKLKIDK